MKRNGKKVSVISFQVKLMISLLFEQITHRVRKMTRLDSTAIATLKTWPNISKYRLFFCIKWWPTDIDAIAMRRNHRNHGANSRSIQWFYFGDFCGKRVMESRFCSSTFTSTVDQCRFVSVARIVEIGTRSFVLFQHDRRTRVKPGTEKTYEHAELMFCFISQRTKHQLTLSATIEI